MHTRGCENGEITNGGKKSLQKWKVTAAAISICMHAHAGQHWAKSFVWIFIECPHVQWVPDDTPFFTYTAKAGPILDVLNARSLEYNIVSTTADRKRCHKKKQRCSGKTFQRRWLKGFYNLITFKTLHFCSTATSSFHDFMLDLGVSSCNYHCPFPPTTFPQISINV